MTVRSHLHSPPKYSCGYSIVALISWHKRDTAKEKKFLFVEKYSVYVLIASQALTQSLALRKYLMNDQINEQSQKL